MSTSKWNNPLLPVLKTLRFLGRFPFMVKYSGELECRFASVATGWALLSTAAQALLVIKVHFWDGLDTASWTSFNAVVEVFVRIFYFDGIVHSLLTTWWATPAVARAYNEWNRFNAIFEEKTNRKITTGLIDRSGTGVVIIAVLTWPLIMFLSVLLADEDISSYDFISNALGLLVYYMTMFYIQVVLWMWIIFCAMVKSSADVIKESLIQSHSGNSEKNIADARILWLELRSCSVAFSQSVGRLLAMVLLEYLYDYIVVFYEIVQYVLEPYDIQVRRVAIVFFIDTSCTFVIFFAASWANGCIHDHIVTAMFLNRFTLLSESAYGEMKLLVNTIEMRNPCFEILGVFTLDKPQYVTILETIITYMVVLVQFNQLSPEE